MSIKLFRNQTGIIHLGLIVVVVSVIGIIGLAAYSVTNKQRSASSSLADKEKLDTLHTKLNTLAGKDEFKEVSKEDINNLMKDDAFVKAFNNADSIDDLIYEVSSNEKFRSVFGNAAAIEIKEKLEKLGITDSSLPKGKKNAQDPGTATDNSETIRDNSGTAADDVEVDLDERTDSESTGASDSSDDTGGGSESEAGNSESPASPAPTPLNNSAPTTCPSDKYLTDVPSGKNTCVEKKACPGGKIVMGISQKRCVRGNAGAAVDLNTCEKSKGRVYGSDCERRCKNAAHFLTNYAGGTLDECVDSWKKCKLGSGWTDANPGFATVGGVNKCYAQGSTPKAVAPGTQKGTMSCSAAEKAGVVYGKYTCAKATNQETACRHVTGDNSKPGGGSSSKQLYLPKFKFVSSKDKKVYIFDLCLNNSKNSGYKVINDGFECNNKDVVKYLAAQGFECPEVKNGTGSHIGFIDKCRTGTITINNHSFETGGKSYKIRVCKIIKKTDTKVSCSQFINYVNTYYYQCPTASQIKQNKCPDKKASNPGYGALVIGRVVVGGKVIESSTKVCKYTYGINDPNTGPKEKAGCEGYLKRVWNEKTKKCESKCLTNHEYWRTITSGSYKGYRQCRVIQKGDSVSSVSPSFCKKLGRNHYFDNGGNGRCGGCKDNKYSLNGYDTKISKEWQICKKKEEKKSSSDVGSKCGIKNSTSAYKSGKYCAGLRSKNACKGTYGGKELKWEYPDRKDGKKVSFHICNIVGI